MENCLFCKIINGEIPSSIVYQDDEVIAFKDINPQAPVHILVVPREHIQSALDKKATDGKMLSAVFSAIAKIAKDNKLDNGFRIINNCGADGGQTVPHLHPCHYTFYSQDHEHKRFQRQNHLKLCANVEMTDHFDDL